MPQRTLFLILISSAFLAFTSVTTSSNSTVSEHHAKFIFLYKVVNFVAWPDKHQSLGESTALCIYGDNPFIKFQDNIKQSSLTSNSIYLHHIHNINDTKNCHIIFISKSEQHDLINILDNLRHNSILTISDIPKFAYKNGMIEISTHKKNKNLNMKINITSIKKSNIKLNSNLLDLATAIYTDEPMDLKK